MGKMKDPREPTNRSGLRNRVGVNVKRLRVLNGMSQQQLGERAGLCRTEIGLIEKGGRLVRIDTAIKLATALHATTDDLTVGIVWKGPVRIGEKGRFETDGRERGQGGMER